MNQYYSLSQLTFPRLLSKLFKDTFVYGSGYILTSLSAFFLLPLYLKYLSPTEFGILSLARIVPNFIMSIMTLGLYGATIRFYYEWKERDCEQEAVFSVWIFSLFWGVFTTLLLIFFGEKVFNFLLKSVPFNPYIKIVILTQAVSINLLVLNHLMRIKGNYIAYSITNNGLVLLNIGFSIFFVAYQRRGIEGVLFAGLIANLIMLIPTSIILIKNTKFHFSTFALKESLMYCIPQIPGSMMNSAFSILDKFFLDKFVPVAQIGIYSLAKTVASIVTMVTGIFQFCLVPFYMQISVERLDHRIVIGHLSRYFIYLTAFLSLIITMFSTEIINFLGKADYLAASTFVGPLVLILLIESIALFPSVQIQLSKVTKYISIMALINFIIFVGIGYPLISRFAINGVIITYFITDCAVVLMTLIIGHKCYPISINIKKMNLALIVTFILAFAVSYYVTVLSIFAKLLVMFVFVVILLRIEFNSKLLDIIKNIQKQLKITLTKN